MGREFDPNTESQLVSSVSIPDGWSGFDIGPETIARFGEIADTAKTVIWNGPLGVYEFEPFAIGTLEIARRIANSRAVSIIGGGDCVAAVHQGGGSQIGSHTSPPAAVRRWNFLKENRYPGLRGIDR